MCVALVLNGDKDWQMDATLSPTRSQVAQWNPAALPDHHVRTDVDLGSDTLTVVRAPMGFGKSTLLRQWHSDRSTPESSAPWVTVGSDCLNWDVFCVLLLASLDSGEMSSDDIDLADLESRLSDVQADQRVLFVDQADRLAPGILRHIIDVFTARFEDPFQVVLASRSLLCGSLGSSNLSVRLIGVEQLALSESSIRSIVSGYAPDLSEAGLAWVVEKASGWALGARIAGCAIGGDSDPERVAREFSGTDVEMAFALETDSYSALEPDDRDFLIRTSVLCELSLEACEAVTGDEASFDRLARLARKNGLIYTDGNSYRFVPFVREFLLQKLDNRFVDEADELWMKSIQWYYDQADHRRALQQAASVGHWTSLVNLVIETGLNLVAKGHAALVLRCIRLLPPELVQFESGVAVVGALACWTSEAGSKEAAEATADWLNLADMYRSGRPPNGGSNVSVAIDSILAFIGDGKPEQRKTLARRALSGESTPSEWAVVCHTGLGLAALFTGDLAEARRALSDGMRTQADLVGFSQTAFGRSFAVTSAYVAALIESELEDFDRFDYLVSLARVQARDTEVLPVAERVRALVEARCLRRYGDVEEAARRFLDVAEAARTTSMKALALLDAAEAFHELGRPEERLRCLNELDEMVDRVGSPGHLVDRKRKLAERRSQKIAGHEEFLTAREIEVLQLLQTELSRREIAERLYVAHNTVKTYVQRLYRKLGVTSRPAAVVQARERGWI